MNCNARKRDDRWIPINEAWIPYNSTSDFSSMVLDRPIWQNDYDSLIESKLRYILVRKKNREVVEINSDTFLLGRNAKCDYCFHDSKAVSKNHAKIVKSGESLRIIDLQSSNGTFVNGERVKDYAEISEGDLLKLADEELLLVNYGALE